MQKQELKNRSWAIVETLRLANLEFCKLYGLPLREIKQAEEAIINIWIDENEKYGKKT